MSHYSWPSLDQPNMMSSTSMNVVGMLYPANVSSNTSKSDFALEAITPTRDSVVRVQLKPKSSIPTPPISQFSTYGLVPGNVVACKGVNYDGQTLLVEEFLELPRLEEWELSEDAAVHVLIFAGPFHLSNIILEPVLQSMQKIARTEKPDAVILVGPFVTDEDDGQGKDTFAEFVAKVKGLDMGCEVVYVPSTQDAVWGADGRGWFSIPQPKPSAPLPVSTSFQAVPILIHRTNF